MKDSFFLSLEEIVPFIGKDRKRQEEFLLDKGLTQKMALYFVQHLEEDWILNKDMPYEKKIEAMKYGFFPGRVKLYNLNRENYRNYLADIDYFRLHPLNNHFAIWVNDKLTLKYVIPSVFHTHEGRDLSIMPEYYLYIENNGRYSYLMDSPKYILHDENYLLNLLKEKQILALKPSRGAGGYGFVKLQYVDGEIYANSKKMNKAAFDAFRESLNGYLVTEYVSQHTALDTVWDKSVCTLRIISVKNCNNNLTDGGKTNIIVSYARFGTERSNGASNLSSGGVGIAYDFDNGRFADHFYQYLKYASNGNICLSEHPDTKVSLSGKMLPHWKLVRDVVYSVCDYLSSLEYFGFDLMVTEDGVKMCEINTHPSLDYEQVICGPIWLKPAAKEYFEKKMKEKSQ